MAYFVWEKHQIAVYSLGGTSASSEALLVEKLGYVCFCQPNI